MYLALQEESGMLGEGVCLADYCKVVACNGVGNVILTTFFSNCKNKNFSAMQSAIVDIYGLNPSATVFSFEGLDSLPNKVIPWNFIKI